MKQTTRFWNFIFFVFAATALTVGSILVLWYRDLTLEQVQIVKTILFNHLEYLFCILILNIIVIYGVLETIYNSYVKPLRKISAEADVIYASNPCHRIQIRGNRDIRTLASVVNNFADMFEHLDQNITQQILSARKEIEKERNMLAAVMSELPQGVFICNLNGRILLYNSLARKIFTAETHQNTIEHFIGLGRSIFHLIDKSRIDHALEEISFGLAQEKHDTAGNFIFSTNSGRFINVEVTAILNPEKQMTGYILALKEVSDEILQYDLISEKFETFKQQLQSRQDTLLTEQYDQLTDAVLEIMLAQIPLNRHLLYDILITVRKKLQRLHSIDLQIDRTIKNKYILVDSFSLISALVFFFKTLTDLCKAKSFQLNLVQTNKFLWLEINWSKSWISVAALKSALADRMDGLPGFFYLLKQNRAWLDIPDTPENKCQFLQIVFQEAPRALPTAPVRNFPIVTGSRPEFYDFNLFSNQPENHDLLEMDLKEIIYTVFDTETTGLNPDGGDEIVSIAAVRIINQHIQYKDIFDQLVNPERDIPLESYKIHGISYEMVRDKKNIQTVLPEFKKFTSDTVLVGHNIAFDMKILEIKEKITGIQFNQPVVDTLLLSSMLHPVHEQHDLESIAARLGVDIVGRHTALGDTIATARIFLKLIPLLNSRGIYTLKEAIAASKKTYYARLKY